MPLSNASRSVEKEARPLDHHQPARQVRCEDGQVAQILDVSEGALLHGIPYLAFGSGSPLLVLRGFMTVHANPVGLQRRFEIRLLAPLAQHFQVYAIGRAPGTASGASMADIAREHAEAVRAEFGTATDVLGISSGGSVALQLAADHPDVVRRLVMVSAGHRLGTAARQAQLRYVDAAAAGRRGAQFLAPFKVESAVGARLVAPVMWLLDPLMRPRDTSDMVAFARAEDVFDLGPRLGEITAPTLVIAGERDKIYSPEIFRRTAEGVADGRLIVYPGTGHGGVLTSRRFASDVTAFLNG
jgi:pimeloyl-ACP methyl ester carboxylesterase